MVRQIVTVTFMAMDECGNASESTATFTIEDTTHPAMTIPADYTAECSDAHPLDEATARTTAAWQPSKSR